MRHRQDTPYKTDTVTFNSSVLFPISDKLQKIKFKDIGTKFSDKYKAERRKRKKRDSFLPPLQADDVPKQKVKF